jgi:dGTPase
MAAERAVQAFTGSWISHLEESIVVERDPHPRSAHVTLDRQAWHEVAVLKFVHQRFVLERPDLAMFQRGQAHLLSSLVSGFEAWLTDTADATRAPRRLIDLVDLATRGYLELRESRPDLLIGPTGESTSSADDLVRLGRGRGIIDYVASFTDDEAVRAGSMLSGGSARLWGGAL